MTYNNKNLTQNGINIPHFFLIVLQIAMFSLSLYLTKHYFDVKFPESIESGNSACDLGSFLNCDSATFSPISNLAGVPISIFSIILSAVLLISSIFASPSSEKTSKFLLLINAIGCFVLLIYSLLVLKSLCPFCTLYYLCSWAALFLFIKYSDASFVPEIKNLAIWGLVAAGAVYLVYSNTQNKDKRHEIVAKSKIEQFYKLETQPALSKESPFYLHEGNLSFQDAKIKIAVFSDFQCPFCKFLSDQLHKLARRYKGQIHIQYFFFPLDMTCNPKVNRKFHEVACLAAYVSSCRPENFAEVHDEIFDRQDKLDSKTIQEIAQKFNVQDCYLKDETKIKVQEIIKVSDSYNISSTPTLLINGKKIQGGLSIPEYIALFDDIIAKDGK